MICLLNQKGDSQWQERAVAGHIETKHDLRGSVGTYRLWVEVLVTDIVHLQLDYYEETSSEWVSCH